MFSYSQETIDLKALASKVLFIEWIAHFPFLTCKWLALRFTLLGEEKKAYLSNHHSNVEWKAFIRRKKSFRKHSIIAYSQFIYGIEKIFLDCISL